MHLHHPEERIRRVDEREVDHPRAALARKGLEAPRWDPLRDALRRLLLEEAAAFEAFAPALHRERAVAQVRHEHGCDGRVVVEQVRLGDPVLWEEDAIGARELDLRQSRNISRAITSRWIWLVPS